MSYDKEFAKICTWLKSRGYTAHTFNSYKGAKGKSYTELQDKHTNRFVRRI